MDIDNVPQDTVSTYSGNKKAVYATDSDGQYAVVKSSGWNVEKEVTIQALEELQRKADQAYGAVVSGDMSPLYYHMYAQRMDLAILAQSVGIFKWRVKRHLKPAIFRVLSADLLSRYADALGVEVRQLQELPKLEDK